MNFLDTEDAKNHLLYDIVDVDEFVLRECRTWDNHFHIFDLRNAKRLCCEYDPNEGIIESEISLKGFIDMQSDGANVTTRLNYENFENEFLQCFQVHKYYSEWLNRYHYDEGFFYKAKKWIEETEGDASKKLRLRNILAALKGSNSELSEIKDEWNNPVSVNEIQKNIIDIFKNFTSVMSDSLKGYYKEIFPELFKSEDNIEAPKKDKQIEENEKTKEVDNLYPRIFITNISFIFFKHLQEKICIEKRTYLADYSFVFRKMMEDKYLHPYISESEFRDFLYTNYNVDIEKLKTLKNCWTSRKETIYNSCKN